MRRSLIVTDLTRFGPGNPNVCIAGIDRATGECVRPIPYLSAEKSTKLGIVPGGILTGEFTPVPYPRAPHTEDCFHGKLKFSNQLASEGFRAVLAARCFASVEEGFEIRMPPGKRVVSPDRLPPRSIITLKVAPRHVEILGDSPQSGKIKLHFTDSAERQWRFIPITDLQFHDLAQRHRENNSLPALNARIAMQQVVFLRVGLTRLWTNPDGIAGYWLQANGIYTFPTLLR